MLESSGTHKALTAVRREAGILYWSLLSAPREGPAPEQVRRVSGAAGDSAARRLRLANLWPVVGTTG